MPTAPGARRVFISFLVGALLAGVLVFFLFNQNQDTRSSTEPSPSSASSPIPPSNNRAEVAKSPPRTADNETCQELYTEIRQFMDSMPTELRSIKGDAAKRLADGVARHEALCRGYLEKCASQPSSQIGEIEFIYAKHLQALKLRRQTDFLSDKRNNDRKALRKWLKRYMAEIERLSTSAFGKLAKDNPWRPQALQLAGQAASAAFRPEAGQGHFEKLLELYPDYADADAIQLALARALFDFGAYMKAVPATLKGLEKYKDSNLLPVYGELLWKIYHAMGDFDGMEELLQHIDTHYPIKLTDPTITDKSVRDAYERFLDFNGFRKGYLHFAQGDFGAASMAFQEHIDTLDKKEKESGSLRPEINVYRMRSSDCLSAVEELAGLPAPAEFDLGKGWATRKHVRVAESSGKVIAVVFRGIENARSAVFVGPVSQFCANRPDIEMVTISYLQGSDPMSKVHDNLNAELGTLGYEGAAGVDPDAEGKQIFRKYHANVGSATFVIINRRGELVWFMQDPRGVDVQFAEELLKNVAERS